MQFMTQNDGSEYGGAFAMSASRGVHYGVGLDAFLRMTLEMRCWLAVVEL